MVVNNGAFFSSLNSFIDGADKKAEENTRKVLFLAWQGLIDASPVDLGTFKGNWTATVNSVSAVTTASTEARAYPNPSFKMGDKIFLGNALPYAMRIESGWSRMAPQGVVGPTRRGLVAELRK